MSDAETFWIVVVGALGLAAFAGGSILADLPRVDASIDEALGRLRDRRSSILAGSVASGTGAGLLLWPISAVATGGSGEAWPSLVLFGVGVATLATSFMVVVAVLTAALVWRDPTALPESTLRLLLDGMHLAIWSVSAPLAAVMVCATTAAGVQNDVVGPLVVIAAALKVVTVIVEVVGLGSKQGWNAGGWAAGSSGYATVLWFALLLIALA